MSLDRHRRIFMLSYGARDIIRTKLIELIRTTPAPAWMSAAEQELVQDMGNLLEEPPAEERHE